MAGRGTATLLGRRPSPETLQSSPRRVAGLVAGAPCGPLAPGRRVRSGADQAGQIFEIAAGGRGNPRHFRKRPAYWRQRVADAAFKRRVGAVEFRTKLGRPAQIGAGRQDAEAAAQPRHAGGVGPVRRLAGLADDAEHVFRREIENRQPVEDLAARDAHPGVTPPRRLAGARGAFLRAHAHCVDEEAAEAGVGLEVP